MRAFKKTRNGKEAPSMNNKDFVSQKERLIKLPSVVSYALFQKSIINFNTKSPKLVSVEVSGAGSDCVDGTYVVAGVNEDALFFSRSGSAGVFGESEKQFFIWKQQDCFYISSFDRNEFNSAAVSG